MTLLMEDQYAEILSAPRVCEADPSEIDKLSLKGVDANGNLIYSDTERTSNAGSILTYPGNHLINLTDPDPEHIDIRDIAHALANVCRYNGHIREHYSVAQHSVIVSKHFADPKLELAGLLHDAEEAYFGDMVSPLKKMFPEFGAKAAAFRAHIFAKFGVDPALMEQVKHIDEQVYYLERASFWPSAKPLPFGRRIKAKPIEMARADFLHTFEGIMRRMND